MPYLDWIIFLVLGLGCLHLFTACLQDGDIILENILWEILAAYSKPEICDMYLTTAFSQEYMYIYAGKNYSFSECVRLENHNCITLHFSLYTLLGLKGFGRLSIAGV